MPKYPTGKRPPAETDKAKRSIKNTLDDNSIADYDVTVRGAYDRLRTNMTRANDVARHAGADDDEIADTNAGIAEALAKSLEQHEALIAALRRGAK